MALRRGKRGYGHDPTLTECRCGLEARLDRLDEAEREVKRLRTLLYWSWYPNPECPGAVQLEAEVRSALAGPILWDLWEGTDGVDSRA
jgi:hypothetical protein